MKNNLEVNVIVHRGTSQIGGCCTEIRTSNTRIIIDMGQPLPEEEQSELVIDGVTFGITDCDALFVTHYHGDHIGQIRNILPQIPIYMSRSTFEIIEAYRKHGGFDDYLSNRDIRYIEDGISIQIKDIEIIPIASDHSSFEPFMFWIKANGKQILHTGDYRLHGLYSKTIKKELTRIRGIDLLITEGTTLTRHDKKYLSEMDMVNKFRDLNEKYKYVFLLTSSGNIDRLAGFSMSIPKGKYFIVDEFQNELLDIVNKENRACGYEFKKKTVYGKNLTESFATRGFGMVVRANGNFQKLVEKYASEYPKDTCLIYSLWSGYKTMPNIEAMLGVIENVFFLHSSGHIVGEDFVEMLENVNPRKVLVIHTEKANIELNCGAEILSF